MSLRDALLKSGAVSKKQVRDTDRRLKKKRKKKQGSREKKKVVETRLAKEQAAAAERERQERLASRKRRDAEMLEQANALRVRHLLQGNRVRWNMGKARFYHLALDGQTVVKSKLPWKFAHGLRAGTMAMCALVSPYDPDPEYVIVPRAVAEKVLPIDPRVVVFLNAQGGAASEDPEAGFIDDFVDETFSLD